MKRDELLRIYQKDLQYLNELKKEYVNEIKKIDSEIEKTKRNCRELIGRETA